MVDFNTFEDTDSPDNVNISDGIDPTKKAKVSPDTLGDNRLFVDANLKSSQLVPTITNKLRIRSNIGDIALAASPTYTTLYTRSGTGLFFGFQTAFDGSTVKIKLSIDGGQVFDLLLDDIRQFQFNDTSTTRVQMGGFLTTIGNTLDFSSRYAIPYTTSITLEATSVSGGKKNKNWMVIQTEDT